MTLSFRFYLRRSDPFDQHLPVPQVRKRHSQSSVHDPPSGLVHFQGDGLRLISKNVKSEEDQTRDAHLLRLEVEAPSGIFVNARCETISNEYEMAELSKLPRSEAARILRCRPAD